MSRKTPLVTFSGIDGCGKSTQMDQLSERLAEGGRAPVRLWSRGGYTEGMLLAKRLARRLAGRKLPKSGHSEQRERAFKSPVVARAWLVVAILDLVRLYGLNIRLYQLRGRPVICDRYLWDTLIDFRMLIPDVDVERWPLWRLLVWVAATPDRAFLLDLDPEEAERRSLDKGDPWPEPMEARRRRERLYRAMRERGVFDVIDASRPPDAVFDEVTAALFEEAT